MLTFIVNDDLSLWLDGFSVEDVWWLIDEVAHII